MERLPAGATDYKANTMKSAQVGIKTGLDLIPITKLSVSKFTPLGMTPSSKQSIGTASKVLSGGATSLATPMTQGNQNPLSSRASAKLPSGHFSPLDRPQS